MAAFNHVRDLNDVALKPRLLRNLLKEHLPTETCSLRNPADIAAVVSAVRTHQLLSEQLPASSTSAVNAWVDHILLLARSNSPDKCWAGVCLLGVTCTGCNSDRFLSSFSDWFNVLVSHIQPSGVSDVVRVASCAAASDLLTRLGGFSNIKKDGISCAGKLVQPILKTLTGDASEDMLEIAAELLCTVLTYFPSSLHRYYDNAEAAIVSKIMSGNCSSILLMKLACCLASLPRSKGDEESWSLMMQKILSSLNSLLDSTLEGLEEESRSGKAIALLVPPGKCPPPPLGGQMIGGEANNNRDMSQQYVISIVSCLMQCCCTMLTSSYMVQVVVPVRLILATIERVLMVNGSLPEALQPFTTAMQQELVCLHLPALHQNVLDVLAALQKGLHSQVLPYAAEIVKLLTKYFEQCRLPELRTKAYTVIRSLLISMGSGMALYISQVVIDNGLIDLKAANYGCDEEISGRVSIESSQRNHRKRRKHGSANGALVEQQASVNPDGKEPPEHQASIALKIAAVEALEALVLVGGSLRCDSWRSGIDHLLMEVVTNACKGDWNHFCNPIPLRGCGAASEDLQLVTLRAFFASLLSPPNVQPLYLAQGLELFLKGKQNAGTKVAEFCAQALVALEVLIHPRALPLVDTPLQTGNNFTLGRTGFGDSKYKLPSAHGIYPDVYDVLNYVTMEDGFGSEALDTSKRELNAVDGSLHNVTPDDKDDKTGDKDQIMLDDDTLMGPPAGVGPVPLNKECAPEIGSTVTHKHKLEDDNELSDSFPDIVDADPDTDSDS
ncbi:hypothetical protein RND81_09G234100 [Saponaria officinalis]|uniref:Pre-rRNA-processing protein RIX1 N-terminal domain-containing protein n=1 Tax=Saponaria officinalis TaxID=3572 RepID=A0AAW1IRI4_SAPOF